MKMAANRKCYSKSFDGEIVLQKVLVVEAVASIAPAAKLFGCFLPPIHCGLPFLVPRLSTGFRPAIGGLLIASL